MFCMTSINIHKEDELIGRVKYPYTVGQATEF